MKRVGIMGGSFNPVHIGHVIIADYIRQHARLDEVWLMLSPLNPLKEDPDSLADDSFRLEMLTIACNATERLKPCDIELDMPRPSYTSATLAELSRRFPDTSFSLIIGGDNWAVFDRWKNFRDILDNHEVIVYPRPDFATEAPAQCDGADVKIIDAPTLEISSTFIRRLIKDGFNVNLLLPAGVYDYIKARKLYS